MPVQNQKKGRGCVLQNFKMTPEVSDLSWKALKMLSLYNLTINLQMLEDKTKDTLCKNKKC